MVTYLIAIVIVLVILSKWRVLPSSGEILVLIFIFLIIFLYNELENALKPYNMTVGNLIGCLFAGIMITSFFVFGIIYIYKNKTKKIKNILKNL